MASDVASTIGMVTGIIGSITGIAGAVMGLVGYRHSRRIGEADRRLELHKIRNAAHVSGVALIDLLPRAFASRQAVLNASGLLHSGTMEIFKKEYELDNQKSTELVKQIPSTDEMFNALSRHELDQKIIEMDRLKRWIDELLDKYRAVVADDDLRRAEIRARMDHR